MIDSITIQNFRCFEDTTIKGFGLVNLIGGKNNSGKTVLLEAILINQSPDANAIEFLQHIRRENEQVNPAKDSTWDSLFYALDRKNNIYINSYNQNTSGYQKIKISIQKDQTRLIEMNQDDESTILNFTKSLASSSFISLHIQGESSIKGKSSSFMILSQNNKLKKRAEHISSLERIGYMSSNERINDKDIAQQFDVAFELGLYQEIIHSLQIIDKSIINARTSTSSGSPKIMLSRDNNKFIPINLFGDATTKILDIILAMITAKNSIMLIDEIENGIHHSNQKAFWQHIIKLAKEFNVQVFATTHSEEMIKALNEAAFDTQHEKDVMYFELIRHTKTNKIKGLPIDMPMLKIKLLTNTPHRGE